MPIYQIDHLVFTVKDIAHTCSFYQNVLGIPAVTFDAGRVALLLGNQKINLHAATAPIMPHARHPTVGSADICLITDTPLPSLVQTLTDKGVAIVEGPVQRTGTRSQLWSIYLQDPDGNLIEIANSVRSAAAGAVA